MEKELKEIFLMANYKGGCAGLLEENLPWVKIKPGRTIRGLRAPRKGQTTFQATKHDTCTWIASIQTHSTCVSIQWRTSIMLRRSCNLQMEVDKLYLQRSKEPSLYTFHMRVMRLTVCWQWGTTSWVVGQQSHVLILAGSSKSGTGDIRRQPEKANWPSLLVPCDFSADGEVSATKVHAY